MYQPIDGPAVQTAITATTTPVEVKVGAQALSDRKIVVLQPQDGNIYWGYNSNVTPGTGFLVGRRQQVFIEAGEQLPVYIVAGAGSVDVRIAEAA